MFPCKCLFGGYGSNDVARLACLHLQCNHVKPFVWHPDPSVASMINESAKARANHGRRLATAEQEVNRGNQLPVGIHKLYECQLFLF